MLTFHHLRRNEWRTGAHAHPELNYSPQIAVVAGLCGEYGTAEGSAGIVCEHNPRVVGLVNIVLVTGAAENQTHCFMSWPPSQPQS
jgi:hypothetical protein